MRAIHYKCSFCDSTEVKLWREYGIFETKLYCFECIQKLKQKENSNWKFDFYENNKSYIIDWFVPAVISKNGFEFESIHNYDLNNWVKLEPEFEFGNR